MKKGFTLLELIVVIIILGILATLGFSQYTRAIERSRGAEARNILGQIRTEAATLWIERNSAGTGVPTSTFIESAVGIGNAAGQIANTCAAVGNDPGGRYFFRYTINEMSAGATATGFNAVATRCAGGLGKSPSGPTGTALTLMLTSTLTSGTDSWGGNGGY